jgi:hypothetical protein
MQPAPQVTDLHRAVFRVSAFKIYLFIERARQFLRLKKPDQHKIARNKSKERERYKHASPFLILTVRFAQAKPNFWQRWSSTDA